GPVKFADANRVADLDAAVEDAADGQAAQVVARVEIGDERLQRRVGRPARRRDVVDHRIEQWTQVRTRLLQRQGGRALSRVRVEDGEVELVFRGVEIDEEVVDLVQDRLRPRVAAVDLVDDDEGREPALERLSKAETRLRQRALGRV